MVGKRGWLRILEAFIAIILITGFLVFLYSKSVGKETGKDIYNFEKLILDEISSNFKLREAVLNEMQRDVDNFVATKVPAGFNFSVRICEIDSICALGFYVGEAYASERIISSTLKEYEPKKIKIFMWKGKCERCLSPQIRQSCSSDTDCGVDGFIESRYCKNSKVYQKYRNYNCVNKNCKYKDEERLIEDCKGQGKVCRGGICMKEGGGEKKEWGGESIADFTGVLVSIKKIEDVIVHRNLCSKTDNKCIKQEVREYLARLSELKVKFIRSIGTAIVSDYSDILTNKEVVLTLGKKGGDWLDKLNNAANDKDSQKIKKLVKKWYRKILIPNLETYAGTGDGKIEYWQILNEETNKIKEEGKFGMHKTAYSLLLTGKAGSDLQVANFIGETLEINGKTYDLSNGASGIVRQVCPGCKVVIGGFGNIGEDYGQPYLRYLYENNVLDYIDVIDFHANYRFERGKGGYSQYWAKLKNGVDIIKQHFCGGNCQRKPIWVTEGGSPSEYRWICNKAGCIGNGKQYSMSTSLNFQADDVIKRYISSLSLGIGKLFWNQPYNLVPKGGDCPIPSEGEKGSGFYELKSNKEKCRKYYKGLLFLGNTPKPSFDSYKLIAEKLAGVEKVERIDMGKDSLFLFKASFPDGIKKFIAWCDPFWNDKFEGSTSAWNYEDKDCSEVVDLEKEGVSGKVRITKRDGSTQETEASSIQATKSPIFIEEI